MHNKIYILKKTKQRITFIPSPNFVKFSEKAGKTYQSQESYTLYVDSQKKSYTLSLCKDLEAGEITEQLQDMDSETAADALLV